MPLYLVPGVREFDFERTDLPPSIHYVGPYLWNKPRHVPPPAWLASLRTDRPWVHATEGTVHVGEPFVLRAAVEGLANLPVEAVLTTGGRDPAELDLGPLAANVHLARWISHTDLLPRTSIRITTGGAGSVLAALNAHVPLILVPTEWDKPEVAQRVVEAGAGLRISPRRCTPKRLRAAVERILGDESFRQNAQRLARIFAGYTGAATAAGLLEDLAKRSVCSRNSIHATQ
jgi:MGT family glycosyltransferase